MSRQAAIRRCGTVSDGPLDHELQAYIAELARECATLHRAWRDFTAPERELWAACFFTPPTPVAVAAVETMVRITNQRRRGVAAITGRAR